MIKGEQFKGKRKTDNHMTWFEVKECAICGTLFSSERCKNRQFCSKKCSGKHNSSGRFGELNSNWGGGIISDGHGYILEYIPETHTHRKQHHLVWEREMDDLIRWGEVIHHIDFDKTNNQINNLMKFSSQKEHMLFHQEITKKIVNYLKEHKPVILNSILNGNESPQEDI